MKVTGVCPLISVTFGVDGLIPMLGGSGALGVITAAAVAVT